jgi:phosphoglucosamine mutase
MNDEHIFGDDGFRGVYGTGQLSKKFLLTFGEALGRFCEEQKLDFLYIGHDGRGSSHEIIQLISSGLKNKNIKIFFFGLGSTPSIAFPTRSEDSALGIMITASHFPPSYNGVKLFYKGYKLAASNERRLEVLINEILKNQPSHNTEAAININKAPYRLRKKYQDHLNAFGFDLPEGGLKIDAANGGASRIARKFASICSGVDVTYCRPNGENINHLCGAIESQYLRVGEATFESHLLLDGDADRVLIVDRNYGALSSELLASIYLKKFCNSGDSVVCSEVVNTGFLEFCAINDFKVEITPAGDRNVVERALQVKARLGFEPSGHFFIPEHSTTMDGLLFGAILCKYLFETGKLKKDFEIYTDFKREIRSYPLREISDYESLVLTLNHSLKLLQGSDERIFCRKSIWENVLRVYCDSKYSRFSFDLIENELKNYEQILF